MFKSKKLAAGVVLMMSLTCAAIPVHEAQAFSLGSVLGSVLEGDSAYKELNDYIDKVNNTDEGRTAYFEEMKKEKGVCYDTYHTELLDDIMERLTNGIGESDPSIYEKPFLYFLNNDTSFNASCGLGHVMTVNMGLF